MKRVLLLVVDGCTSRILGPALDDGRLPTLAELARRGTLDLNCLSIFPSITPAATASIVTGHYPARHGIAGMSWWNPASRSVSYLGDDVRTILQRGIGDFLSGFLNHLNGDRLQAPTFFQIVERHQRRAACFNHLIFRGDVAHEVSPPLLLRLPPSVSSRITVYGPSWLCLGDFVSHTGPHDLSASGGMFNRYGMDDQGTEQFLKDLPDASALPDFTVAYFADYDFDSHENGPVASLETLERLDGRLAGIFEHWGGLDRVLADTCVMLTADHSHSDVAGDDSAAIVLDDVLGGYQLADPAVGWQDNDDLLVCPNMRAAEVFLRADSAETVPGLCATLLEEPRVDHVLWRTAGDGADEFHVATRDRGALRFRRAPTARSGSMGDEYGGCWEASGDLSALDAHVEDGRVRYGDYPNALERIANGIDHPRGGRLWVTARPGHEFNAPGQSVHHAAGSHGTLHALDSVVPLLITGQPADAVPTATSRIVDVVPWCARLLGIPFEFQPGDSRY